MASRSLSLSRKALIALMIVFFPIMISFAFGHRLVGGVVSAILIITLFALFRKEVVEPLRRMSEAVREIATGNYGVTVPVGPGDEIGELAESFNLMSREIHERNLAIRNSEMRFRNLVESTSDWIWEMDEEGVYTYASPRIRDILGYDPMEVIGKTPFDFMPPDEAARVSAIFKPIAAARKPFNFLENLTIHEDGHRVVLETSGVPFYDVDGRLRGYRGIGRDVTERKKAERESALFQRLSLAISESKDVLSALQTTLSEVCGATGWVFGEAWFPSRDGKRLECKTVWLASERLETFGKTSMSSTFMPGKGLPGRVWSLKQPVWIRDVTVDANFPRASAALEAGIKAGVGIPIFSDYEVVAVMIFFLSEPKDEDERLVRMISTIAAELGVVIRRKQEEDARKRLTAIIETTSDFVATGNMSGHVTYYNMAARKMLGIGEGEDISTVRVPDTHPEWAASLVLNEGIPTAVREGVWRGETAFLSRDGREIPASQVIIAHKDPDGNVEFLSTIARDMTETRLAEMELKKLSAALENSTNIVFITDKSGVIEYVNPIFERITGWARDEAIGKRPSILSSGEISKEDYAEMWKTILQGNSWRMVIKNRRKDGRPYWANQIISPIINEKGEVTHFFSIQEDITEKKLTEERAEYLATHDEMTGIINRSRFMELLSEWFYYNVTDKGAKGVLLLVDIDGFKFINDTYGHGVGDELLRRIAQLLQDAVKGNAVLQDREVILGRLGGDEFAFFIPQMDAAEVTSWAEKIRKVIEETPLREGIAHATVSIGIALSPEHGITTKELFIKVDAAKNRAKKTGRNKVHLYRPEDRDLENVHSRLEEKERIVQAIKDDRFIPWFQPIMNLKSGKAHHYEALARMRDIDGKILFPNVFIDTAERFGLIGNIDRTITEKTMRLQAEMGRQGRYISFAMNLSGKNLGDEELLSFLRSKIEETGADPDHLVFEITETAAVKDLSRAIKFITSLKEMGCHFSLDDFGVGFTSFVYLRDMGVDYLKIDGSFVKRLPESANDRLFVRAITDVARGMGIETIAEFVENEKILDILHELGVDYAQGYHIGKPGPDLLAEA